MEASNQATRVPVLLMEPTSSNKYLNLEKLGTGLYRSIHHIFNSGNRSIFGGQVVGLALVAAGNTVEPEFQIHSLHSYFIRGGINQPILFKVESTRDGKTYCNRNVKAIQNGLAIFTLQCSFKKQETDPYEYQYKMPEVPKPEDLQNKSQLMQDLIDDVESDDLLLPSLRNAKKRYDKSIFEVRPVDPSYFSIQTPSEPTKSIWIKTTENLGNDQHLHRCAVAMLSDTELIDTCTKPKARLPGILNFFITSIDHTIWFHNSIQADSWLLYDMQSPITAEGRGFAVGRIWTADGILAMSIAQEGIVRTIKPKL